MNFRVDDEIKVVSGQYTGMQGTVVKLYQVIDNVQGDDSHDVTWRPTDGLRAAFDVLVSVVGFGRVWFTPEQITKIDGDAEAKEVNLNDVTWEPTGASGGKEPDHYMFDGKVYDYPKGYNVMYDLSLSKNTIRQLMMSIETCLLFFEEKLKTNPQNKEIIELQKQRRRAVRKLLDAVVEHRDDFEPDFGYLSAVIGESEEK